MYCPKEVASDTIHGIFIFKAVKVSQRKEYLGLLNADLAMIE